MGVLPSLVELVNSHSGKVTDKWSSYIIEYNRLFEPYRHREVCLFEIGVQNGGSLEIWSQYFPHARLLLGCDLDNVCRGLSYEDKRVQVVVGDANAAATCDKILSLVPCYDLIIDDGSHTSSDIVKSFALYFGALSEGGSYVVEDLHCSYWSDFQGGLLNPFSSIHFFKSLCDIVNHQSWGLALSRQDLLKDFSERYGADFSESLLAQVHSVEFLNSLCVIRKASADHNTLGIRVVRGRDALVDEGPLQVDGHEMAVPGQQLDTAGLSFQALFKENLNLASQVNWLKLQLVHKPTEKKQPAAIQVSSVRALSHKSPDCAALLAEAVEAQVRVANLSAINLMKTAGINEAPNVYTQCLMLAHSTDILRATLKSLQSKVKP